MITTLLTTIIGYFLIAIFYFLPIVTLDSIPIIGEVVRGLLVDMVEIWNSAIDTLPHLGTAWNVFKWVIIPMELTILVARFFLGHRTPINHA